MHGSIFLCREKKAADISFTGSRCMRGVRAYEEWKVRISDFYIAGGCVSFLASAGFMAWICADGMDGR